MDGLFWFTVVQCCVSITHKKKISSFLKHRAGALFIDLPLDWKASNVTADVFSKISNIVKMLQKYETCI